MKHNYYIQGGFCYFTIKRKSDNKYIVISIEDEKTVFNYRWFVNKENYVYSTWQKNGKREHIYLHQLVMGGKKDGLVIDHINRNPLDNRRQNLRYLTPSESCVNRDFGCKGPYLEKRGNKKFWRVRFKKNKKYIIDKAFSFEKKEEAEKLYKSYYQIKNDLHLR